MTYNINSDFGIQGGLIAALFVMEADFAGLLPSPCFLLECIGGNEHISSCPARP